MSEKDLETISAWIIPKTTPRTYLNKMATPAFRDYFGRFLILFWGVIYAMLI